MPDRPHAHVDVATDHALFHVAIAHAAIDEDVLEGVEIFVGHVRAGDVGFGDDFQQRHAGAVEIHAAVAVEMEIFADVLLEMRAGDAHAGDAALELKIHVAADGGGLVVLCDLIILGRVGIEIILAVELGKARDAAIQQVARQRGQAQALVIGHGQDAGQAEADRADVGVGRGAKFIGATAPHLRFRFELDVRFQPDDSFVVHKAVIFNHGLTQMDTDF